jgi:hypothetical protein
MTIPEIDVTGLINGLIFDEGCQAVGTPAWYCKDCDGKPIAPQPPA